jgi:hypothetical protein
MNALERKLIDRLSNHRDSAPVYRIEPQPLDELEKSAAQLGNRIAGHEEHGRARITRGKSRSDLALAGGFRARAYHASGAIAVKAGLAPMDHVLGEKVDKNMLIEASTMTAKRLGLDRLGTSGERLAFERLWQIKAAGVTRERQRSSDVVCRAVGAFRRYVGDLPVYERASVVIELADRHATSGVGVDWRPIETQPLDLAKVLDPERAAHAIVAEIGGRLPGGEFTDKDFDVTLFSLGYISLPKRRAQGLFAPVYVAMLERRAWSTMNHVVVVNGTDKSYESVTRIAAAPPRETQRAVKA